MPSSWASLRCCRMYDGQYWLVGRSEIMVAMCSHEKLYIWNIKYSLPYIAREDQSPMASLAHLRESPVVTSCLMIDLIMSFFLKIRKSPKKGKKSQIAIEMSDEKQPWWVQWEPGVQPGSCNNNHCCSLARKNNNPICPAFIRGSRFLNQLKTAHTRVQSIVVEAQGRERWEREHRSGIKMGRSTFTGVH